MVTIASPTAASAAFLDTLKRQFRNLDPKDPASWPSLPRYLLCACVTVLVIGGLWFAWLQDSDITLQAEKSKELQLREDYKKKLAQAVNLEALKKQREQVQQYVTQLEKQLPGKAEMDALLSDINQAGLGRSLQFDLFRPGQISVKEYYAELPIAIRAVQRHRLLHVGHRPSLAHCDVEQFDPHSRAGWRAGHGRDRQDVPLPGSRRGRGAAQGSAGA